jgi:glycosyltransferase involved in cell wall biosynthesis
VLLHFSWTEAFNMALSESMACGVAPVVTPAGAAYDVVRDGESGVRVPADPVDAAKEVIALERDRELLHRLRVGAQRAIQGVGWPGIAARTAEFYASRIAATGRRR